MIPKTEGMDRPPNGPEEDQVPYKGRSVGSDKVINTMIFSAREKSKERNLGEFDLEYSDIVLPEYCPVLGIKLNYETEGWSRPAS